MIDVKHIAKDHASQNIPLEFWEAYGLGTYMLDGCHGNCLAQIQTVAMLSALHTKATYAWQGNGYKEKMHGHRLPATAAEQIAGICAAVFRCDIAPSEFGFLRPNVSYAMDNCGMGGDLIVTANVSTIAALIAAVGGIAMCKHGSPANADKGRHGSSDFMTYCGIDTLAPKESVERCVESLSFGYTEALDTRYKLIHTQTHAVAKLPHMNDIIGPITNPLDPKLLTSRVLGVNHLIPPRVVAEAYTILNDWGITSLRRGLFIRGFGDNGEDSGMDELSICKGGTQVAELCEGKIKEYWLYPEDFGLEAVPESAISPAGEMSKGDLSMAILRGDISGAPVKMVAANAALLFYLADFSNDLRACYREAEEILVRGQAFQRMMQVREFLPR